MILLYSFINKQMNDNSIYITKTVKPTEKDQSLYKIEWTIEGIVKEQIDIGTGLALLSISQGRQHHYKITFFCEI